MMTTIACPRCHGNGDRPDGTCWLCEPTITTKKHRRRMRAIATFERRAVEAMRTFPLPSQGETDKENYRRVLDWLYLGGGDAPASLVIDLGVAAGR